MPLHLILGGRYMGKRAYAESLYGVANPAGLFDFSVDIPESITASTTDTPAINVIWLVNLQDGVRILMQRELESACIQDFFVSRVRHLQKMTGVTTVAIGVEISCGIVPIDPFERRWRDETGRLYQALAHEADIVDRVWSGLAMRLKTKN